MHAESAYVRTRTGMTQTMTQQRLPQAHEYQHLGAYMRDLRLYYQLQVVDVAKNLHIRAKYIQAMEEGTPELMPGKVYARGYIANYAEFLGLNGDAIADQYLAEAATPKDQSYFVPEVSYPPTTEKSLAPVKWALIFAVICALTVLAIRPSDTVPATIEQVPENLADSIRNGLMPTPDNAPCLLRGVTLACVQHSLSSVSQYIPAVVGLIPVQWHQAKHTPLSSPAPSRRPQADAASAAGGSSPGGAANKAVATPVRKNDAPTQSSREMPRSTAQQTERSSAKKPLDAPERTSPKAPTKSTLKTSVGDAKHNSVNTQPPKATSSEKPATPAARDPNAPVEIELPRRRH